MRLVVVVGFAAILLAATSSAKERSVVSVSSEPTGLTVKSQRSGKKIIPGIDIYSDGTVLIRRYDGSEATKHIDASAIETLLQSLNRTRFYKITENSFNTEVNSSQPPGEADRIVITDCPIWTIRTRNAGVTRSTKFYGLWEMAEHYPHVKQLKTLKDAFLMVYSAVAEEPF
jgi:hypothetical protein